MQFWLTLRISCNCNTPPRTLSLPRSISATCKRVGIPETGLPCFDDAAPGPTPSASSAVMSRSDHGCLQRRRSSPLGGFKPAQAGRTSGDVFIPHFPPSSALFCPQRLRRELGVECKKLRLHFLPNVHPTLAPKRTPHPRSNCSLGSSGKHRWVLLGS